MKSSRSLWMCPDCGRQFVSVNGNPSCGGYRLEDHFARKEPVVRELYDLLLAALEQFGPVGVYPVKTRTEELDEGLIDVLHKAHRIGCEFRNVIE